MKKIRPSAVRCAIGTMTLAAMACTIEPNTESEATQAAAVGESHPYQAKLICERAPGSTLVGVLYDVSNGSKVRVAQYTAAGNVGACELAARASRNQRVCIPGSSWSSFTIYDLSTRRSQGSYATLAACTAVTRGAPTLRTEPGYVDFIAPAELAPFRDALPRLADPAIDAVVRDPRTMWYDEASLAFVYQDSFGSPKGLRANRVGYDVGSTASEPDIRALTEYFQPTKFKFPFAFSAGATFEEKLYVMNFWRPPTSEGGPAGQPVKPVRIWKNNSHWQWVFPVGTVIGEALFIQAPDDGKWFAFEVRARRRSIDGWVTSVFRPYVHAEDLARAIKERRPGWSADAELKALVDHVESSESLTAHTMSAPPYAAIFPPLQGALDYLPPTTDIALVKDLLAQKPFENAMGSYWKASADGRLKSYAPSTRARFHVVPREYMGGMLELTESACRKCHEHTSRPLNNLDPRVVLYGEIWGEDEIFTWHPFAIDEGSFGVGEGTRFVNQRLVAAGLVEMSTPASAPETYRPLPKPYRAQYE